MALTKPHVQDLANLGFAQGYWDCRGSVNFGTGVITTFVDARPAISHASSYVGDAFAFAPYVIWSIANTNVAGVGAGAADRSRIIIGASGSSAIDNVSPTTTGDTGTLWDGALRLIQEGGVDGSPNIDIDFGFGPLVGSNGFSFFIGRISFIAVGIKV